MIKALHLHSGNMFGGVERVLQTIASVDPSDSGIESEFALCFSGELTRRLHPLKAVVHDLGSVRLSHPWTAVPARARLTRLLRERAFDVVISHSMWVRAVFAGIGRGGPGSDVFWVHDALDGKHWLQRLGRYDRPDLAICASPFSASRVPRVYPGLPTVVLDYPLEYVPSGRQNRDRFRAELGADAGSVVVVQLGRLEPYKGHKVLLEALGRLRSVPGWTCWQVGGAQRPSEEAYLRELKELVSRLGIAERVRFLGQQVDVPTVLGAADVYCQPNVEPEPYGLVFIEAMREGLAVVTSRGGGGGEIVGDSGWLVDPGNVTQLAEVLNRLISDEALRTNGSEQRRAGAAARTDPLMQMVKVRNVLADAIGRS